VVNVDVCGHTQWLVSVQLMEDRVVNRRSVKSSGWRCEKMSKVERRSMGSQTRRKDTPAAKTLTLDDHATRVIQKSPA